MSKVKRITIDLDSCRRCKECTATCSYSGHPDNRGIVSLLELSMRLQVCRKCEEAPCVRACPRSALEKQQDGSIKRFTMYCTGCKTCTLACPFGVIYPEIVPYLISQCDFCAGRISDDLPECVTSCPHNAIRYIEEKDLPDENIDLIGNYLAVHSVTFVPEEPAASLKDSKK